MVHDMPQEQRESDLHDTTVLMEPLLRAEHGGSDADNDDCDGDAPKITKLTHLRPGVELEGVLASSKLPAPRRAHNTDYQQPKYRSWHSLLIGAAICAVAVLSMSTVVRSW